MVTYRLVIVRHGETAHNKEGRMQGQTDIPLNECGEQQARQAGAALARHAFSHAFSSDLSRARATATLILGGRGPALSHDPRLRERSFGAFEGKLKTDVIAELKTKGIRMNQHTTGEGGETVEQVTGRMVAFFSELCQSLYASAGDAEPCVLLVSHGMALLQLLQHFASMGCCGVPAKPHLVMRNTAFSEFVVTYTPDACEMQCVAYNQYQHTEE